MAGLDRFWEQVEEAEPPDLVRVDDLTRGAPQARVYVNRGGHVRVSWLVGHNKRMIWTDGVIAQRPNRFALIVTWGEYGTNLGRWLEVDQALLSLLQGAGSQGWNAVEQDMTLRRDLSGNWQIECHPDSMLQQASATTREALYKQIEHQIMTWPGPHFLAKVDWP